MGAPEYHPQASSRPVSVHILVVSSSRSVETDLAGPVMEDRVQVAGHRVLGRDFVGDDETLVRSRVRDLVTRPGLDVLIVTGGTGCSLHDRAPEAVRPLFDLEVPGFGELFRILSLAEVGPGVMLSRATAGFVGSTFVALLPGSPTACVLALDRLILPVIRNLAWERRRDRSALLDSAATTLPPWPSAQLPVNPPPASGTGGTSPAAETPSASAAPPVGSGAMPATSSQPGLGAMPATTSQPGLGGFSPHASLSRSGTTLPPGSTSARPPLADRPLVDFLPVTASASLPPGTLVTGGASPTAPGWKDALLALGGEVRQGEPPLRDLLRTNTSLTDVLHTAGQRAVLSLPDGYILGLYGFPDLIRPSSKVLAVGPGSPWGVMVALHRYPRIAGLASRPSLLGLPDPDMDVRSWTRETTGFVCPGGGRAFAIEGATTFILRQDRVWSWDGRRQREEGAPLAVIGSLALRWSGK
jgi:molybdopterin adenylyltransferase